MSTAPGTPDYKPGDIVNGHKLTVQPDRSLQWVPIEVTPVKKKSRLGLWISLGAGSAVVGLIVIVSVVAAVIGGAPRMDSVASPDPTGRDQAAEEPLDEPENAVVPDVIGMPASTAIATLRAAGFDTAEVDDPDAIVIATTPAKGEAAAAGSTVTLTVEVKPKLTLAQENAVAAAKSYIAYQAFSRIGLISQLEFEGYSTDDAIFAVDYIAPDWNEQAAAKARSYLDYQSFSREGLYEQLIFEGFSDSEATAGLAAVGY